MFIHCGTTEIKTERLILRRFRITDAEDALKYWLSYPMVTYRYMLDKAYTDIEGVNELLTQWINRYASDNIYKWAIEERASCACIGDIYLWDFNTDDVSCEMGYALSESHKGMGYMTEACKAVINFTFEKLNADKINVCTRSSNIGSQRVIAKCGFTHISTDEKALWENGAECDRYFYSLTRKEWLNNKSATSPSNGSDV
jgi:ribosomal-protein-alanine N-acetyltransferase